MTGERKPFPVTQTAFNEGDGRFSPDGRLIAYTSNESGRGEVYVQAFPEAVERWQVSNGGGSLPHWRGDGKELFYLSSDRQIMSVGIQIQKVFSAGPPRPLFRLGRLSSEDYDVASDGQRFLFIVAEREASEPPISLVFNWRPEGKR